MSFSELLGNVETSGLSNKPEADAKVSALDLFKSTGSTGSTIEQRSKEAAGAALLYLMACELTLVTTPQGVPPEAQQMLDRIGCQNISIDGKTVRLSLRNSTYQNFDGAPPLWFDKKVSADIVRNDNRIDLNNINGMMVDPGRHLPWAYIKNATFENRDGKCIATVTGGRLGVNHVERIELPQETFDQLSKVLSANGL